MKIFKSNMLDKNEDVEYLYVFHNLVSYKEGKDKKYAISKKYYFQKEEHGSYIDLHNSYPHSKY